MVTTLAGAASVPATGGTRRPRRETRGRNRAQDVRTRRPGRRDLARSGAGARKRGAHAAYVADASRLLQRGRSSGGTIVSSDSSSTSSTSSKKSGSAGDAPRGGGSAPPFARPGRPRPPPPPD